MTRGYNFGAGPSMLPESILRGGARRVIGLAASGHVCVRNWPSHTGIH